MANTLIIITGPTAIGKTRVAIDVAKFFSTQIISADSRQIYREISIGTAVPSADELAGIKHHFIHSHSILDTYNASRFETEAIALLENLFAIHEVVVMAGGSMLYIDAVCKGIDKMPDVDPELRKSLKNKLNEEGIESLRMLLKTLDPDYYYQADLKNATRVIHALEICIMTGKPYSSFRTSSKKERPFDIIKVGLDCDRTELHKRINRRVDHMLELGLENEARNVYPLKHLNALCTVGYREFFDYFDGKLQKHEAVELIKRNTRRYARKQLTWFRNDKEMNWFHPFETDKILEFLDGKINET